MIETVLMLFTPRQKAERLRIRQFSIEQQHFAGGGAGKVNGDVVLRGSFAQPDVKGVIFLFVDQLILLRRRADRMPPDLIRQQRGGMFTHVVDGLGVIHPDKIW